MKLVIKIVSFLALGLTIIPAFLVFFGVATLFTSKVLMFIGSLTWFATAPSWMNQKS